MNDFWNHNKEVINQIVFLSFGIIWLSLNFYIWECYKMKKYKEQIDKNGIIHNKNIDYPIFNFFLISYLFSGLPKQQKYYKFELFRKISDNIKLYRKVYGILFAIYAVLISVTIYLDINF